MKTVTIKGIISYSHLMKTGVMRIKLDLAAINVLLCRTSDPRIRVALLVQARAIIRQNLASKPVGKGNRANRRIALAKYNELVALGYKLLAETKEL